jgi:hypothetical protein
MNSGEDFFKKSGFYLVLAALLGERAGEGF